MDLETKYNMTQEENIFWAKRNVVDYIWKSANLEGIAVTFPDTQTIVNRASVAGLSVDNIIAINNLKHAWEFLFETLDYPIDYGYICKLHQFVGDHDLIYGSGYIRNYPVTMEGTKWVLHFKIESVIKEQLDAILKIENLLDRGITLMLYMMRKQMFGDGNKRVAMLAANQVLISHGQGVISVPIDKQAEFAKYLIDYYESGDMELIKKYVYDNCLDGVNFPKKQEIQ